MEKYYIKRGYKENIVNGHPKLRYNFVPPGTKYQISVFKEILQYILENRVQINSIIDFGCGSGYKMHKFLSPLEIKLTGVDQNFIVEVGKRNYPQIEWIEDDFSSSIISVTRKFDLIISSDVIEHLVEPDFLLERLKNTSHNKTLIFLSTPERDLVRGIDDYGPPANPKHVREWNQDELYNYLVNSGFKVIEHKILPAKDLTIWDRIVYKIKGINNNTCQLIVCKYEG